MFDILGHLERQDNLMTVKQVADTFQVSTRSVERMITKRSVPSLLIGGQRRFDPSSLHGWVMKKSPEIAKFRRVN